MKKKVNHPDELAALHALGALDGADAAAFSALLGESPQAQAQAKRFARLTESLVSALPQRTPSPDLKARILRDAERLTARQRAENGLKQLLPQVERGLAFLKQPAAAGWLPLPVAGAFVKLLSFDETSGYAVVLGKLEAAARYPGHTHCHAEDIFMLSGDLHIGDEVIRAGDFHHATAGSQHGVNWSEEGCTLLCVLSKEDLLAQLV